MGFIPPDFFKNIFQEENRESVSTGSEFSSDNRCVMIQSHVHVHVDAGTDWTTMTPIGQIGKLFQGGSLDQECTIQIHQRDQRKQVLDPIWELQQE